MELFLSWVVFPVVLGLLALGCGLLLERIAGKRLAGAVLLPAGLAVVIVVGLFATLSGATADLAAPLAVALAAAGFGLTTRLRERAVDWWALAAGVAAYAAYAAPTVLSGEATFAGYIKLDDTASFLGMTDRVMEHGRSLDGLAISSYHRMLDVNLVHGYPVGSFMPLGLGSELVGEDPAWLFQPAMAFSAAMLALVLYALLGPLVERRWLRALAAWGAAQPALLFAFSLWGGIKELAAAAMLPLVAALVAEVVRRPGGARALLPAAVATAALLGVLSIGGGLWLAPILIPALVLLWVREGLWATARAAAVFAVLTALLAIPSLSAAGEFLRPANEASFRSETDLGNLIRPLALVQVFGIWPTGDFRVNPDDLLATRVLIGLAALVAVYGLVVAWMRRAEGLLLFAAGSLVGGAVVVALGSPWLDSKALATASPAVVLAALGGLAVLFEQRWRAAAVLVGAGLLGGVLWSNVLAYREVWLAPRGQLAELERIGERFAGAGPALMTEYQPYGVRHFLRNLDAEGASELRYRPVPLRDGRILGKSEYVDLDQFRLPDLFVYRTLVLRRAPAASRPPAPYRLAWRGRWYDVWQRRDPAAPEVIDHLPLGDLLRPGDPAPCDQVLALARRAAEVDGRIAAAVAGETVAAGLEGPFRPASWSTAVGLPGIVLPADGTLATSVTAPAPGSYEVWVGGSSRGRLEASVDGRRVGSSGGAELNNTGQYIPLGRVPLGRGPHRLALRYGAGDLGPGGGGPPFPLGPLILATGAAPRLVVLEPSQARSLCGRRLDWVEAVRP
jgi:hypothetical protein